MSYVETVSKKKRKKKKPNKSNLACPKPRLEPRRPLNPFPLMEIM